MYDLCIVIPGRNEMFMGITIQNLLDNIRGNTEIIAVLDGYTTEIPDIPIDNRVRIIKLDASVGQRAATNLAVKETEAKYVMKMDAHCSVKEGFDVEMVNGFKLKGDNCTMVPVMRNLWAFDWKCMKCGNKRYQGPTPTDCPDCDNKTDFKRKIVWKGKDNPQSTSYCFDSEPHFQYFKEYTNRAEYVDAFNKDGFTETMSLQGSCFMLTRDKYWELDICSEDFGSWGSQGIEVAVKTWLSGGQVLVNHHTWYAHMFRTQKDFSFPYPAPNAVPAKRYAKNVFFNKDLIPILEKFWPVSGWSEEDLDALYKI
jgi:glycosyltransferase involved in cell wall biosynthesis